MRTSICCAWWVAMWLTPGWTSSAFVTCTPCYPQLGPAGVLHRRAPHGAHRRSNLAVCCSIKNSSTSSRNSLANDNLLGQTARPIRVRLESHAAGTAVPLVGTTSGASQRPSPASSLTIAILESTIGDFSPRQLRNVVDSPAYRDLEYHVLGQGGAKASRAEASLRELLEAIISVVGEGDGSCAAKVVAECPALLLCEGRELLATVQELRDMEGMTEEKAMRLAVELPSFFTLPPAARERVGFFLGEVGLTAKEVGRLAKRHPDVIEKDARGHARRIVDIFLQDLQVGKAAFRRMVRRQPGLLSLSVTGNVLEKVEFFTEEMGLRNDQIAKMVCAHPQILFLSLENSIRPIVQWLGSPDPEAWLKERSLGIAGAEAEMLSSSSPLSSKPGTDTHKGARVVDEPDSGLNEAGATPACSGEVEGAGLGGVVAAGVDGEAVMALIEMPAYVDGEWDWGLGLDREGRSQVVSKQGDVLWKSVPGNLAKSTAWFVQEVGLGWDDMRKLATRAPTLLSLSVENNLEPTLGFLVKELGMDPANLRQTVNNQPSLLSLSVASNLRPKATFFRDELGANERDIAELLNQCPRVMNASVHGRILPRVQVMRSAGISPTFRHLRAICTYPDVRFAPWVAKLAVSSQPPASSSSSSSSSSGPATAATTPSEKAVPSFDFDGGAAVVTTAVTVTAPQRLAPRRGRRLRGEPPRPSVRTNSLAELGVSYTVSPRRRGAVAALSAAAEEREAFAPGRAGGKAVVRRVSRGLEVLDLYCGTGGFAMNAAVGKARSALGVDKDARAVRTATTNASANGLGDTVSFVRAGVLPFAEKAASEGRAWDLVVLDLPSLPSKSAQSRSRAANTYTRLAESSSRLVRSGGMLMAIYEPDNDIFETPEKMVEAFSSAAARAAGISLTIIDTSAAAAAATGYDSSATGSSGDAVDYEGDSGVSRSVSLLPMRKRRVSGGQTAEEDGLLEGGGVHSSDVGVDAAGNRAQVVEDSPLWWALFVCSKAPLAKS